MDLHVPLGYLVNAHVSMDLHVPLGYLVNAHVSLFLNRVNFTNLLIMTFKIYNNVIYPLYVCTEQSYNIYIVNY